METWEKMSTDFLVLIFAILVPTILLIALFYVQNRYKSHIGNYHNWSNTDKKPKETA